MAENIALLRDAVTRIPVWTGDSNDIFTQWLQRIEKARVSANWDDAQTMSFAYVSLRGEALSWYEVLERSGITMTYAGFKVGSEYLTCRVFIWIEVAQLSNGT